MSTVLHKLQVEIGANAAKFGQGTKDAQKSMNSFSAGLRDFGNQTNIAGHNVGGLASQLVGLANPATAAAAVIGTLSAAYLNTHAGAEALEEVQFRLEASFEILGREVASFIDTLGSTEDPDSVVGAMGGWKNILIETNPIVIQFRAAIGLLDKATGGYISKLKEEEEALAALKGIYDDLLRDRIIESEQISELDRKIERLKTQRVEENVTTKEKIELDRQILKLEEDRFLILVSDAEKRRQALEAQVFLAGGVNKLNEKQLELLIDTRNEVKNLEAEYQLRIRKIRKELTGLLQDLSKASSFKFEIKNLDTGEINFPGEFKTPEQIDQAIGDKQLESIVKETEALLGLGEAYNNVSFNYAQWRIDQDNAALAAEETAAKIASLGFILGDLSAQIIEGGDTVAQRQEQQVRALGNATVDIVDLYFKQSIAAAISNALKVGGPAGLAIAGIGIAAVRALFNKAVGSHFKGGGGGAGSISSPSRATLTGNAQDTQTIVVTGQISGNNILLSSQKTTATNKSVRVGG